MRSRRFPKRHGFRGNFYPVNPSYSEILGVKSYPDIRSLPEPVDHIFSMIGSDKITGLLDDCAYAGANVVTIYSDGFGEKGFEGLQRKNALLESAQSLGLRVLGPNSIEIGRAWCGEKSCK